MLLKECSGRSARWIFPVQTAWNGGLGGQMSLVHGPTSSRDLQLFSLCGHVLSCGSPECIIVCETVVCCCASGHICHVSACAHVHACTCWPVCAMRDQCDILLLLPWPGSYLSCPGGLRPNDTHSSGVCLPSLTHSLCVCLCVRMLHCLFENQAKKYPWL